ncbi:hypothetical protein BVC80_1779g20 [Macleaya cordata]|uniref:Uncharacterized protein n=1 Tax=Macleaya cordata TaxID=56857 RepID=A0A200QP64_MACCD|nr:hypothetical protein BVC80_1779g20 [Macleaya cordata]
MRLFLWGENDGERKYSLVAWTKICKDKGSRGLGIRSLKEMNNALLCKWHLRFSIEEDAWWRTLIAEKYSCEANGWDSKPTRKSYGVGLWRGICNQFNIFKGGLKYMVGPGHRVRFWTDWWIGEQPLYIVCPRLYAASRKQNDFVSEIITRDTSGGLQWNLDIRRRIREEDLTEVTLITRLLESFIPVESDSRKWNLDMIGDFTMKSCYAASREEREWLFPQKDIWDPDVPTKVGHKFEDLVFKWDEIVRK